MKEKEGKLARGLAYCLAYDRTMSEADSGRLQRLAGEEANSAMTI